MFLSYLLQGIISFGFSYFLFRFFEKQLKYSLILSFTTFLLLNFILGILGNLIVIIYIGFGLLFKVHSKNSKWVQILKKTVTVIISILLIINIIDLPLKFLLHKNQLEILIKIAAITLWSSLLLMFLEMKNHIKNSSIKTES